MGCRYEMPTGHEIKKRTFEGKHDPSKNDNSLTSKYMPSYRYWMVITYPHNPAGVEHTCRTKKEAEDIYRVAVSRAGSLY